MGPLSERVARLRTGPASADEVRVAVELTLGQVVGRAYSKTGFRYVLLKLGYVKTINASRVWYRTNASYRGYGRRAGIDIDNKRDLAVSCSDRNHARHRVTAMYSMIKPSNPMASLEGLRVYAGAIGHPSSGNLQPPAA